MAQSETQGRAQEQGTQQGKGGQQRGQAGAQSPARLEPEGAAWHPMTSFRRIFEDFDRLFEDMQRGVFARGPMLAPRSAIEAMLAPVGLLGGEEPIVWAPRIEIRDKDAEYVIAAELPGVDPKDVQVEVTDEGVVLRGETRREETREEGGMWRSERRYGRFLRQIPLPPDLVDADRAQAQFVNGLLTIRLPKTEAAQQRVRRIQIVSAEPIAGGQQAAGGGEPGAAEGAPGAAGGQTGGEGRRRSA